MKTCLNLVFIFLISSLPLFASAEKCQLLPSDINENLNLTWKEFDQTEGQGHRKLALKGCFIEAATLIDVYILHHQETLEKSLVRILYFHAGQMYAYSELNSIAVQRMIKSLNPNEPLNPELNWNDYVQASVGFLQSDIEVIKLNRKNLAAGKPTQGNKINLSVVDQMIKCFGKPYSYAFGNPELCQ